MLRATLKNLAARKLRLAMSAFAVVLGVAFVVGSYVFTDTMNKTFDDIFGGLSADVVVRPDTLGLQDVLTGGFNPGSTTTVPATLVDEIARLPGVERADGEVERQSVLVLDTTGKVVTATGAPGIAVNWHDGPAADGTQVVRLVAGRVPEGPSEVALDDRTFDDSGYRIGDQVQLITAGEQPRISAELVGVVRFGDSGSLAGASLSVFETSAAQDLFLDGANEYSRVAVTTDGTSAEEVRDEINAILPDDFEAVTGATVDEETASAVEEGLGFFTTFLLVFAGIALFVGVFLILNTFSILIAQRSQEMALMRALGATQGQVTRSVMVEAFVVGLVGSTLGLLLGVGVAQLLTMVFAAFGFELSERLVLLPRTIIVAYLVGVLVTMVAAFLPARRAGTVPPIAAMRDDVVLGESSRRVHSLAGGLLTLGGVAAMLAGLFADVGNATWVVGSGILAIFVGVALLAPIVSVPILHILAGWYPSAFGTVGRLAIQNALRNPRRTAATSSALMIGMALVAAISIVGSSANASVEKALDDGLKAQFVITNAIGMPFSATIASAAAKVEGVGDVASVRISPALVDGRQSFLQALDPAAFDRAVDVEIVAGTDDLSDGTVLVGEDSAKSGGLWVGDSVQLTLPGSERTMTIAGIYADMPLLGGGYVVSQQTLIDGAVPPVDVLLYVVADEDANMSQVQSGLERVTADLPTVAVLDQQAYKEQSRDQVNQLLYLVYALLGLAILIAVLGIVNTLALSVMERTREVGLLRAVGFSRRQLRSTIRLESIAIAVLGAVLGISLGLIFGVALQRAIAEDGLETLAVPGLQLAVFVVLSAMVGVLAAVWPARRAAKLDVLRAITTE